MKDKHKSKDPKILMQEAKQGDSDAFSIIYEMYFTPIYRYIYFRVHNKEETEDLVFRSLPKFEDKNIAPLAFFYTVARNTLTDHWRRRKDKTLEGVADYTPSENSKVTEALEGKELMLGVHGAIGNLNEEQQEVVVLKFVNEMSTKEIAEALGKREDAVRQLQCRALQNLRKYLKQTNSSISNHENT